jgi:hypothetical protein
MDTNRTFATRPSALPIRPEPKVHRPLFERVEEHCCGPGENHRVRDNCQRLPIQCRLRFLATFLGGFTRSHASINCRNTSLRTVLSISAQVSIAAVNSGGARTVNRGTLA